MEKYILESSTYIEGISSEARLYRHRKSGARVYFLLNDDVNRVFGIAFRTPPRDSTGIAHITEHSVLCGSDKYPLKDPFIELAKGSLNTFLNAMTYPDKTVYPIASTNELDYKNLTDVYLDSVFHPFSVKDERIMRQEGWHYEEDENGKLVINGVVYNEMKGVYSSPDAVLEAANMKLLFPDNIYSRDSGGDPDHIPDLTFSEFVEFHKEYYHPSNSYIFFYGKLDESERLEYLDREYLSKYSMKEIHSEIELQKPFSEMRELKEIYSVGKNEDTKGKTYLSYSFVTEARDRKTNLALSVLDHALISSPGAPLKKRLLEMGLGDDIFGGFEDGIIQPYFNITAKGTDPGKKKMFLKAVDDTLREEFEKGLDRKTLLSAINADEFNYREADFGNRPKGLIYSLTVLDSLLYGGDPWEYLDLSDTYRELREEILTGYFERLLKEKLLENPHKGIVILKPERGYTEKKEKALRKKLDEYKKSLTEEELKKILKETEDLKKFQESEEKEEDLLRLPVLKISDISRDGKKYDINESWIGDTLAVLTGEKSNGIVYLSLNFNTYCLSEEELSYAGILKNVLGLMDTENMSYQDLSSEILLNTGGISFDLNAYPLKENRYRGYFSANMRMLSENTLKGLELSREMLLKTRLSDTARLSEILKEQASRGRISLEEAGNTYSSNRAMSYFSAVGKYTDITEGISFYKLLERLSDCKDQELKEISEKLSDISSKLFDPQNMLVSVTGDRELLEAFRKEFPEFLSSYKECFLKCFGRKNACSDDSNKSGSPAKGTIDDGHSKTDDRNSCQITVPGNLNEGFETAMQVNFVSRAGHFNPEKYPYTGSLRVLRVILNYDYLWTRLRVLGGAYGCSAAFTRSGEGVFSSYRDPNVLNTVRNYEDIPSYIRNMNISERDMRKFIIGAVSELDRPKTCRAVQAASLYAYLTGITNEMLAKEREELLSTTPEIIRGLASYIEEILDTGALCAIGNQGKIGEGREEFLSVKELFGKE